MRDMKTIVLALIILIPSIAPDAGSETPDGYGMRRAGSSSSPAQIPQVDLNADGKMDLEDLILSLKVLSETSLSVNFPGESDVNDDTRLGMEEAIHILNQLSEAAPPGSICAPPTSTCIASGNQDDIHAALEGVDAEAVLCPGALFELTAPVEYRAEGQKIYTQGYPKDDCRAEFRVVSDQMSTAIDGMWLSRVELRNVIVDGGRRRLGFIEGTALLNFGYNCSDQIIEEVKAMDPRGWVAIYAAPGGDIPCSGVQIRNNVVHTSGSLYARADGISLTCPNSIVEGNTIIDATDGGIVIFQAPGSVIRNNTIRSETISMTYGISMIDYEPHAGNFTGTQVLNNTLDAAGAVMKTGIAMGDAPGCPSELRSRGAVVSGNTLTGTHMGYGFPIMGVEDWTALDNVDLSTHATGETEASACIDIPQPQPAGFQVDLRYSSGTFQAEYENVQLGLLLAAFPEPFVFSQSCLADFVGAKAFQEIVDGARGAILPAIEAAPGGQFLEQCVSPFEVPPTIDDTIIHINIRDCSPTCVNFELYNSGESTVDLSNATFIIDGFLVECEGLNTSLPSDATTTCRIDDFVPENAYAFVEFWGFKAVPRVHVFGYPIEQ